MTQRDYVLRMIEQMAIMVAELRRRIVGGGAVDIENGARALATHAGIDLDLARTLPVETLLDILSPGGMIDVTRVWFLGELLYLEGLAEERSGDVERGLDMLARARRLYGALDGGVSVGVVPEVKERLRELNAILESDRGLPPPPSAA